MNRFFIDAAQIRDSLIEISGEDAAHILRVLRLGLGDSIELCDGAGLDYPAIITEVFRDRLIAKLGKGSPSKGEPRVKVTLYQGIPKGSKMDLIVQKSVELGIYSIVPLYTARSIVHLSEPKKIERKVARWQKIAEEAAKQSKRGIVPRVEMPMPYSEFIRLTSHPMKLFLWEGERQMGLKRYLDSISHKVSEIYRAQNELQGADIGIVIGPEGGFDYDEFVMAKEFGWESITLGSRILRTETAGLVTLASIMFYMEEME